MHASLICVTDQCSYIAHLSIPCRHDYTLATYYMTRDTGKGNCHGLNPHPALLSFHRKGEEMHVKRPHTCSQNANKNIPQHVQLRSQGRSPLHVNNIHSTANARLVTIAALICNASTNADANAIALYLGWGLLEQQRIEQGAHTIGWRVQLQRAQITGSLVLHAGLLQ